MPSGTSAAQRAAALDGKAQFWCPELERASWRPLQPDPGTLGQDRESCASLRRPTTAGVRISNQPITAFFGSEIRTIWTECTIVPSCTRTAGFTPLTSAVHAGASSEGGTKAGSPCALPDALVTADHLGSVIDRPESEMSTLQTPPMTDSGVCTAESSTKDVIKMNLCWRASTNAMEGAGDTDSEFVDTCLKKDVGIAISSTSRPHAREQDHEGDERHTAHTDNQIAIASACPRQRSFRDVTEGTAFLFDASYTRTASFTPLTSAGAASEEIMALSSCTLPDAVVTADVGSVKAWPAAWDWEWHKFDVDDDVWDWNTSGIAQMSTPQSPVAQPAVEACTAESFVEDVDSDFHRFCRVIFGQGAHTRRKDTDGDRHTLYMTAIARAWKRVPVQAFRLSKSTRMESESPLHSLGGVSSANELSQLISENDLLLAVLQNSPRPSW